MFKKERMKKMSPNEFRKKERKIVDNRFKNESTNNKYVIERGERKINYSNMFKNERKQTKAKCCHRLKKERRKERMKNVSNRFKNKM